MVKLNIAQYITEKIADEFNRREAPIMCQLLKRIKELESRIDANQVGLQNVYDEFTNAKKDSLEVLKQKEEKLNDLIAQCRVLISDADFFRRILSEADRKYYKYLNQLEEDISTYKETDQAVRRLASLEGRITILEQKG